MTNTMLLNKIIALNNGANIFFDADLNEKMLKAGIDPKLNRERLDDINAGVYLNVKNIIAKGIPEIDGKNVVALKPGEKYSVQVKPSFAKEFGIDPAKYALSVNGTEMVFDHAGLTKLGKELAPFIGYGFLNGGSASSYIDSGKNKKEYGKLFEIYKKEFDQIAKMSKGLPKGVTPAYMNPDNTPGEDFMALKLRAVLMKVLEYQQTHQGKSPANLYQMFQMDSALTKDAIQVSLKKYAQNPLLKDLIKATGVDITKILSDTQPLMATYTAGKPGVDKLDIFQNAYGEPGKLTPMPGGHGQSFYALKDTYKKMLADGKRYVYLSNIDNMGATINDASVAFLALSGRQGAFDVAFKTIADVKGGILIKDQDGKYNCGDMGVAIPKEEVKAAEKAGKKILFNAATGLFDLKYLVKNIDHIIKNLPLRISLQEKEAGKYMQGEQVTWEVIGMMDNPLFFAVDKSRFLAAKMLIEGLMASGIKLDDPNYPESQKSVALITSQGMRKNLANEYGMKLENNKWVPVSVEELKAKLVPVAEKKAAKELININPTVTQRVVNEDGFLRKIIEKHADGKIGENGWFSYSETKIFTSKSN